MNDLMLITDSTLKEEEIAAMMKMLVHGLAEMHEHRMVHRDVKAANVLLTLDGTCKLADFGVSASLDNTMGKRVTTIGTPLWMAPEVMASNEQYDGKADVWSLGITALEMTDGQPPHSEMHPMKALLTIPMLPPPSLDPNRKWSQAFHDFIRLCLTKAPNKRPTAQNLATHPFIVGAGDKKIIARLVAQSIGDIEDFRRLQDQRRQAKMADPRFAQAHGHGMGWAPPHGHGFNGIQTGHGHGFGGFQPGYQYSMGSTMGSTMDDGEESDEEDYSSDEDQDTVELDLPVMQRGMKLAQELAAKLVIPQKATTRMPHKDADI